MDQEETIDDLMPELAPITPAKEISHKVSSTVLPPKRA